MTNVSVDVPRAYLQINNKKYFLYENEHNTIGRNLKARVNIKSLNVSQLHSCITIIGSQHFLSDFNSTNNTFLNQRKLDPYKLYEIICDDEIKFGDVISTYKHLNPNETNEIIQFGESQSMSQTFYKTNTQNMMENTQVNNINNTINHQATTQMIEYGDNLTTQDFFPSINDVETQKIFFVNEAATQMVSHRNINDVATQKLSIGFNDAPTQLLPTSFSDEVTQRICIDNIDDSGRHTPDDLNEAEISILQNEATNSAKGDVQQRETILNNKPDITVESNDLLNFINKTNFNNAVTQKIFIENTNENSRDTPDHLNEEEMPIVQDDGVVSPKKDDAYENVDKQREIMLNKPVDLADESNDSLNFITTNINDEVTQKMSPDEASRATPEHLNEEEMSILENAGVANPTKGKTREDVDQPNEILNNKPDIMDESSNDSLELMSKSCFIDNINKREISNSTPQKILIVPLPETETEKSGNYSTDADTDIEDNRDNQTVNQSNIIPGTQITNHSILTEKENDETRIEIVSENVPEQPEESPGFINSLQLNDSTASKTVESVSLVEENNQKQVKNDVIEKQQEYIESAELKETEATKNSENEETLLSGQETKLNESDLTNSDHDYYLMPTQEIPQSSSNKERKFSFKKPNSVLKMNASMEKLISDEEELYCQSTQKMNEDSSEASMEKIITDDTELYNESTQKIAEELNENHQFVQINKIDCPAAHELDNGESNTEDDLFGLPPTQALETMFYNIEDNSTAKTQATVSNVEQKQLESIESTKPKETEAIKNREEHSLSVKVNNTGGSVMQKLDNGKSNDEDDLFYLPPTQALEKMYHNIENNPTSQIPSSGSSVEEQFEMMFATQSEPREEAFPATQQLVTILEDKGDEPLLNSINESVDIIDNSVVEVSMALSRQLKSVNNTKQEEEEIPATQDLETLLESREVNVPKLNKIENKTEIKQTNNVQGTSSKVTRKRKSVDDVVKSVSSSKRKKNQTVIEETAQVVAGNCRNDSHQNTLSTTKIRQTRSKKILESSDSEEDPQKDVGQKTAVLPEPVTSNSKDTSKTSQKKTLSKTLTNKTVLSEEISTKTSNRKSRLTKTIESSDFEEDQKEEIKQKNIVPVPVSKTLTRKNVVSEEMSTTTRSRKQRLTLRNESSDSEGDKQKKTIVPKSVTNQTSIDSNQSGQSTVSKASTNNTVISEKTSTSTRTRKTRSKRKIESSDSEEDIPEPVSNNRKSSAPKTLTNKTVLSEEISTNRTINDQNKEQTIQPKRTTTKKTSSVLPMVIDLKVPKKTAKKPEPEPKPAKLSRKMSVTNIEMPLTPSRSRRQLKPKVVFSMMDNPELESAVRHLGGLIVDTVEASTVLVTENVKRSQKLLCAVGQGKPICDPQWIHESKKQYSFLDPWDFIIVDKEAEKKWNFSMRESIQRGRREKLLEDYTFQVMVNTGGDCIRGAIEACGGKCVTRNLGKATTSHIMIVSTPDNQSKYSKIIKQYSQIKVVLPEAIFEGTLRQEYNFDKYVVV